MQELTIVVTGDVAGSGTLSLTGFIRMRAHLLGKQVLNDPYASAADVNGDGKISLTDFVQVKAHLLGKGTITAQTH
ncbi:MAG: hypothetical protein GX153_03185 [Clostridiaceae bacterium]|nr:hypothetical protein [Clostridiaceae bacterium]